MKHSIRTFLLINLLLSVALITSLAIVGNLVLAHEDIQAELDAQLIKSTLRMQSLFTSTEPQVHQANNNKPLKNAPNPINSANIIERLNHELPLTLDHLESALEFQVISRTGEILIKSAGAPASPFTKTGSAQLITKTIGGQDWRISAITNPHNQITITLAEQLQSRKNLENKLTQDSIYIMLVTIPFLGLLIWIIVGRGLHSLESLTEAVKHREPTYLEPVNTDNVPVEIEPIVTELNGLFERLKGAFERHERFTSDAAHELKTPLAALSTQTQVALKTDTPQDRNQALLKVLGGVNRCTHVVQQLLTFSRMCPEAGLQEPEEVNLTKQAIDVAAMLAPEAIAKNVELELTHPEETVAIIGNATAIGILIRNLVDNAIRYGKENGQVTINLSHTSANATIRVIDDGPGIPEELRQRVFERFFRVIGNRSTGSGLGLGIVQQIVKLHKAKIQLLTPADHPGLEVQITFPKHLSPASK